MGGKNIMLCINNLSTDPYFNLATEEYLLKNMKEEIFMLWRDKPCIVVGKNQNTLQEINYDYVKEQNIPVVRRLTGGGAVFHDLGNLNFTFITSKDPSDFNNFKKFTLPIINVLNALEIKAEFTGRNDLTIEGKKFSGNAQCSFKGRVLHHGTLLFSSEIKDLSSALKVNPSKFQGKAVTSVVSRVTNISSHLKSQLSIEEFRELIMKHITENEKDCVLYNFSKEDLLSINKLLEEKYNTWSWNYGNSPKYALNNELRYTGGNLEFHLNVHKGIIKDIKITGDFFGSEDVSQIENALKEIPHEELSIRNALSEFDLDKYFSGANIEIILQCLMNKYMPQ